MSERRVYRIRKDNVWEFVHSACEQIRNRADIGIEFDIEIREPKRTLDANACMWATLADISTQLKWPHTHNGMWRIDYMPAESWKAVLTAAFEQEVAMAQGVTGGTVMLGARTSKYSKRKMGEFLEFVHAFGSERDVRWSARARDELAEFARPPSRKHNDGQQAA